MACPRQEREPLSAAGAGLELRPEGVVRSWHQLEKRCYTCAGTGAGIAVNACRCDIRKAGSSEGHGRQIDQSVGGNGQGYTCIHSDQSPFAGARCIVCSATGRGLRRDAATGNGQWSHRGG